MNQLLDFKPGEHVRLKDTVRHAEYRGMACTVQRVVKSRGVVTVMDSTGKRYDALPENIAHIEAKEAPQ